MKLRILCAATLGGALALINQTTNAQTWHTVDTYQYVPGLGSGNFGLTVAPSGVVFASGWGDDGVNGDHGLVRASADGGTTWSGPLDDFYVANSSVEASGGLASDSAGNLYVAGYYYFDNPGQEHQFVRRSTDGGTTWATVDDVAQAIGVDDSPKPGGLTADAAGNVFVAERMITVGAKGVVSYYWVVRKGSGGTSFSTVDQFTTGGSIAQAVYAHPSAGVFAAGFANISVRSGSSQAWLVRRSLDGGVTWSTVDSYQYSSGVASSAQCICADTHGNLYVVGSAQVPSKRSSVWHWLVRKSSNGGASWTTIDDFAGGQASVCATDSNGNLFVAGNGSTSAWTIRENLAGTSTWQTVDTFTGGATSITADHQGHVYVGGGSSDFWVVRRN
jgi:hypothetical protein